MYTISVLLRQIIVRATAMNVPCLLSVCYYPEILQLRSYLLRQNGYSVREAADLRSAMAIVQSNGRDIGLLVFCHTVPPADQTEIMTTLLRSHSVPTLSICRLEYRKEVPGTPVSISPEDLLQEVKEALKDGGREAAENKLRSHEASRS